MDEHKTAASNGAPAVLHELVSSVQQSVLILGLRPANERRLYFVTTSLIGWAQT